MTREPLTVESIIETGHLLGLKFNRQTNYEHMLEEGTVVFDGLNGQRFLFDITMIYEELLTEMGKALIQMGMLAKCMDIHDVISITRTAQDISRVIPL